MIKLVNLTYDEFLDLKKLKYSSTALILLICDKLSINVDDIENYDWKYGLKIYVKLKDEYVNNYKVDIINRLIQKIEFLAEKTIKNDSVTISVFDSVLDILDREKYINNE